MMILGINGHCRSGVTTYSSIGEYHNVKRLEEIEFLCAGFSSTPGVGRLYNMATHITETITVYSGIDSVCSSPGPCGVET